MASIRQGVQRSLSSCAKAATRFCKSGAQNSSGSRLPGSQSCGHGVNATTGTFSVPSAPASSSSFSSSNRSASSVFGARRFASQIMRVPGEIGMIQSLMPLYTATANSRLVSRLGTNGDAPILQDGEDGT